MFILETNCFPLFVIPNNIIAMQSLLRIVTKLIRPKPNILIRNAVLFQLKFFKIFIPEKMYF